MGQSFQNLQAYQNLSFCNEITKARRRSVTCLRPHTVGGEARPHSRVPTWRHPLTLDVPAVRWKRARRGHTWSLPFPPRPDFLSVPSNETGNWTPALGRPGHAAPWQPSPSQHREGYLECSMPGAPGSTVPAALAAQGQQRSSGFGRQTGRAEARAGGRRHGHGF